METDTEYHTRYPLGHKLHATYKVVVSSEPYKNFKKGDKVYNSSRVKCYMDVVNPDEINAGKYFLVISSEKL